MFKKVQMETIMPNALRIIRGKKKNTASAQIKEVKGDLKKSFARQSAIHFP